VPLSRTAGDIDVAHAGTAGGLSAGLSPDIVVQASDIPSLKPLLAYFLSR